MSSSQSRPGSTGSPHSRPSKSGFSSVKAEFKQAGIAGRAFADRLERLLNTTICDNVKLGVAVTSTPSAEVRIGFGVTKNSLVSGEFPVGASRWRRAFMKLAYNMFLDASSGRLRMTTSAIAINAADEGGLRLCHWDYERDKERGYADAHLHIYGKSDAEEFWRPRLVNPGLEKLHFPVGGRRFRPTLEDVISFLVTEGICEGREGWLAAIEASRAEYEWEQLGAAIRRDGEGAATWLRTLGYEVTPPVVTPPA